MRRAASWTWIGLTLLLLGTGCSSQSSLPPQGQGGGENLAGRTGTGGMGTGGMGSGGMGWGGSENIAGRTGTGGQGTGGVIIETIGGMSGTAGKDGGSDTDAVVCCPPDPTHNNGCMHLGGASYGGMCQETCDFWCSTNWRIEADAQGCPEWRYDSNGPCFDALGVPVDAGDGN
jgi:hypothetical protein